MQDRIRGNSIYGRAPVRTKKDVMRKTVVGNDR